MQEQEQEQQVSIAPLPPTPRTGGIDFAADESLHVTAATSGTPAAPGGVTRLDQDSVEYYDLEEAEEEEGEDKLPPLNVYLNYQTFKLETFAMNHFSPPPKKIKKDTWTKILSFSKVRYLFIVRYLIIFFVEKHYRSITTTSCERHCAFR